MKLARGEGLVSLLGGALGESFLQAGQTLADLDVEARVYYDAHQAGTLKDVFRQGIFDRFNPINAPKDVHDVHIQHVPASIPLPPLVAQVADPAPLPPQRPRLRGPLSVRKPPPKREKKKKRSFASMLSTAPGPHSAGPHSRIFREGGSPPRADIPDDTTTPLGFRGQSASYEAGRTTHNTSPQKKKTKADRHSGLDRSPTRGSCESPCQHGASIVRTAPHPRATHHASNIRVFPLLSVGFSRTHLDLTENPPDPEVMSEVESLQVLPQKKSEDPGQDSTVLILCWCSWGLRESSPRAVMPYY